eukprot:5932404-Amphidinium_carterae.1
MKDPSPKRRYRDAQTSRLFLHRQSAIVRSKKRQFELCIVCSQKVCTLFLFLTLAWATMLVVEMETDKCMGVLFCINRTDEYSRLAPIHAPFPLCADQNAFIGKKKST